MPAVKCVRFAFALVVLLGAAARAEQVYKFKSITNNNAVDAAIGEKQLFMTVSDATAQVGNNHHYADFLFENAGPTASSITRIYWDDGSNLILDRIVSIIDSGSGVDFVKDAKGPRNLPGSNAIDPDFSAAARVGSTPPVQPNGVNPHEWVRVRFQLKDGFTYSSVLAELNPLNFDLRVGIHVQGFGSGGSESFIAVPLPGMAAGGTALLAISAAATSLVNRKLKSVAEA